MEEINSVDFLVCARCYTFNQAAYITDSLDGFCMQETSFPYVCVVVDDASTDGEQDVIRKYLHEHFDLDGMSMVQNEETDDYFLTFARHKTNVNCHFEVVFLKYNHYSIKKSKIPYISKWLDRTKYSALCEGDDYWTSPHKLQKQVSFLEEHPNYSLATHRYSIWDQKEKKFESDGNELYFKDGNGVTFDNYSKGWFSKTLTMLFRNDALEEYWRFPGMLWDITMVYFLLKYSKGYCFSEVMGVYRRNESSIFGKKIYKDQKRFTYIQHKEIYTYEKNALTRQRYYNAKIRYLYFSKGKAFRNMDFSLADVLFIPYYMIIGFVKIAMHKSDYYG